MRLLQIFLAAYLVLASADAADLSVEPIVSRIRRRSVESTALATVGYNKRAHALEIEFHDGLVYRYLEVPTSVYRQLMAADSKAGFYNRNVRGKYRSLRVKPRRPR